MSSIQAAKRSGNFSRVTNETSIELSLNLDGTRDIQINTGLGFFDHMLTALCFHAGWDCDLQAKGDLEVDDHHTVEDCALALGACLKEILLENQSIQRFGSAYAPLDESLSRCVIDISGRPSSVVVLDLKRESLGTVACENLTHFFQSFAVAAGITLHLDVLRGENDHHKAESAFKATALALKTALAVDNRSEVLSTKGVLL